MTRRVSQPVGPVDRIAEHVESEQTAYVEILYPSKWISRASGNLEIGWGNHEVDHIDGTQIASHGDPLFACTAAVPTGP